MKWIEESVDKIMRPVCLTLKCVNKAESEARESFRMDCAAFSKIRKCSIFKRLFMEHRISPPLPFSTFLFCQPSLSLSLSILPISRPNTFTSRTHYQVLTLVRSSFFIVLICCVSIAQMVHNIVHVHSFGAILWSTVDAYRSHKLQHCAHKYMCVSNSMAYYLPAPSHSGSTH